MEECRHRDDNHIQSKQRQRHAGHGGKARHHGGQDGKGRQGTHRRTQPAQDLLPQHGAGDEQGHTGKEHRQEGQKALANQKAGPQIDDFFR